MTREKKYTCADKGNGGLLVSRTRLLGEKAARNRMCLPGARIECAPPERASGVQHAAHVGQVRKRIAWAVARCAGGGVE